MPLLDHRHDRRCLDAIGPAASTLLQILEAFRPGTAPPDSLSIVGFNDADGNPIGADRNRGTSQDQQGFFTRGRGLW